MELVKVGVSAHPVSRCADLQAIREDKLELVWQSLPVDNELAIEKSAHKLLKDFKHKGEWFNCNAQVAIDAVKSSIENFIENNEPIDKFSRLAVSMTPEDNAKLTRLRICIRNELNKNISTSAVVRQAINYFCDAKGVT